MNNNDFNYPLYINLNNKACLVVGGGGVAERKVQGLLAANASVTIIAPELTPTIRELVSAGKVNWQERTFICGDTTGFFLVIGATSISAVNEVIAMEAERKGQLCNIVDAPNQGNFITPGAVRLGSLLLTVSTGGSAALTKAVVQELRKYYNEDFILFTEFIITMRQKVKVLVPSSQKRTIIWRQIITPELLQLVHNGNLEEAKEYVNNAIDSFGPQS